MNWTKYLLDSNKIKAIFGDKIPSIEAIDLHEVLLNRDGPKVTFRFDLSDYPENPPKKWQAAGFNCVQVQLVALSVHDLQINGFSSKYKCGMSISSDEKQIVSVKIDKNDLKIYLKAEHLFIDSISAYVNSN
ncbi:Imm50 family immunity protein [Photobacterium damselae]|uniref:Imm50 family immunity protein n=1 Tax=Photobacterium damselae TaxID=38293 RepID=UPI0011D144B6|nr:Imm50 family immunity protein [Photobacterium damselae]KAB1510307.1 hypothetical protein FD717_011540 [Photobacterium damselae subsp. damselae]